MPNSRINYVYGTESVHKLIERRLAVRLYCRNPPWKCTHFIELTCHQFVELCDAWGWAIMDEIQDRRLKCSKCGTGYPAIVVQQDAFGNPKERKLEIEWGSPPPGWVPN